MEYPKVRRDESVVENHFGIEIKDPYRWLEGIFFKIIFILYT